MIGLIVDSWHYQQSKFMNDFENLLSTTTCAFAEAFNSLSADGDLDLAISQLHALIVLLVCKI